MFRFRSARSVSFRPSSSRSCRSASCWQRHRSSATSRRCRIRKGFVAEVRKRLLSDRALQSQYTYLEHREEISVSKLGKVSNGPLKVYEVYPSVELGNNYKRLIPGQWCAAHGRRAREAGPHPSRRRLARGREAPDAKPLHSVRIASRAKQTIARKEQAIIDEAFALYTITMTGRETLQGHETVVATLVPKPNFKPRTDAGRFLKKFKATAWVSESEYQLVRLDAQAMDDVTFGWGIVGRIHEGARAVFERTKVNGEVWLPARTTFTGSGRALAVPHVRRELGDDVLGLQEVLGQDRRGVRGSADAVDPRWIASAMASTS